MSAQVIASKFRRALRNGTGATFTNEQMKEMASYGILRDIALIEADELYPPGERNERTELPPTAENPTRQQHGDAKGKRGNLSIEYLSKGL